MAVTDKVREYLEKMPPPLQAEVLHYVEYLWGKLQDASSDEESAWQRFSLAAALHDMDEADEVLYTTDDLQEKF